ncbi:hypothetical protein PVAP13_1KG330205 [Panicum virgatum]|uniref:Uncharacterized protein n=1 Tax=Panicum virgatum TaxID=38727 RepID=A0A8T0XIH4_PANVG|nr:hypothetical protein PVAP13_1KG330205 [Panicum virgatum]
MASRAELGRQPAPWPCAAAPAELELQEGQLHAGSWSSGGRGPPSFATEVGARASSSSGGRRVRERRGEEQRRGDVLVARHARPRPLLRACGEACPPAAPAGEALIRPPRRGPPPPMARLACAARSTLVRGRRRREKNRGRKKIHVSLTSRPHVSGGHVSVQRGETA